MRGEPGREPATLCFVNYVCPEAITRYRQRETSRQRKSHVCAREPGGKEEDGIFDPLSIFHP